MNSLMVGIIGFSTVFVVLVILILFITVMSKVINAGQKKDKKTEPVLEEKPASVKTEDDEDEVIAAIAAAIACMAAREGKKFQIRSFRRI